MASNETEIKRAWTVEDVMDELPTIPVLSPNGTLTTGRVFGQGEFAKVQVKTTEGWLVVIEVAWVTVAYVLRYGRPLHG